MLTELDDQELFSRGMASIKSTASYISLKVSEKYFRTSYLQNEAVG